MNVNTDLSLSRRNVLQGTGALVVAFSMAEVGQVLAAAPTADGKPPLLPTELDSWISIAPNGTVTVFFGKIDGGQGTDLAMAQIVAEELDVPMKSVNVVQGDTARTVNQGGIGQHGRALRGLRTARRGRRSAPGSCHARRREAWRCAGAFDRE